MLFMPPREKKEESLSSAPVRLQRATAPPAGEPTHTTVQAQRAFNEKTTTTTTMF